MNNIKKNEIIELIKNEIKKMGYELIDVELNIASRLSDIKLYVDKEGGITIDECTKVNRLISDLIFRKDLLTKNYRLEVSSPGLDRPLRTKRDFQRNAGKNIILEYGDKPDLKKIEGKIVSADDELIIINNKNNECISMSFDIINKGKIKLPW